MMSILLLPVERYLRRSGCQAGGLLQKLEV
jgi:hypothetical protein